MKRILLTLLTFTSLAAQDYWEPERCAQPAPRPVACCKDRFFYTKLGGALISMGNSTGGGLGGAIGYRFIAGTAIADIGLIWNIGRTGGDHSSSTFVIPRIAYLHSLTPDAPCGLYFGGGLGYGGTRTHGGRFRGVTVAAIAGFDVIRSRAVRQFIELEITQPAIRSRRKANTTYSPTATLTFGMAF